MYTNIHIYICIHTNLSLRLLVAHYNTFFFKDTTVKICAKADTLHETNISPTKALLKIIFLFLKLGYVSSLGYCIPFLCYLTRNPNIHDRRCAPSYQVKLLGIGISIQLLQQLCGMRLGRNTWNTHRYTWSFRYFGSLGWLVCVRYM